MKKIIIMGVFCTLMTWAWSKPRQPIDFIDLASSDTLLRGHYQAYTAFYENGGVLFECAVGLFDYINLGVIADVNNVIGYNTVRPHIPGVSAKIRILKYNPGWSIGYGNFYIGSYGREDPRPIYGAFTSLTIPLFISDSEKKLLFSLRMPVQPDTRPRDTTLNAGVYFPITDIFELNFEVANFYFYGDVFSRIYWNWGGKMVVADVLGIELNFKYNAGSNQIARIISIEYTSSFF